jgi:hypothetical protein
MPAELVAEQTITVGDPTVVEAPSPCADYGVVFEDDGTTGYLYALDFARTDNPIVDALHIYDVANVTDRDRPSQVQLVWSRDGLKALLAINGYPHAICNFEARRGYCRTGFPPPLGWSAEGHDWDDNAMRLFE